jgi:TFIIF-interacting CTD phosphatase-like protein
MKVMARPYLYKFLDELSATYEIIVFSNINDSHVLKIYNFIYNLMFFTSLIN